MLKLFLTSMEAIRIAEGATMVCQLEDGREVEVRLPNLMEARIAYTNACLATGTVPDATDEVLLASIKPVRIWS